MNTRVPLAVSLGCPAGIGPEVAVRAAGQLTREHPEAAVVLVGDLGVAEMAARTTRTARSRLVGVATREEMHALGERQIGVWLPATRLDEPVVFGRPTPAGGAAQLAWIDEAADLVTAGLCDALVTAPVSKAAIASSGVKGAKRFRGHTEHLARRVGASEVVMAFVSDALATALVTTHLPLSRVPRAITEEAVAVSAFWLAELLARLGRVGPIAVTGLNPHAGEGGLLGHEETERIAPGIALAKRRLAAAGLPAPLVGPLGAESAYRLAVDGIYAGVVAMYHDQATIAGKLVGFGEMVNVTLGLPIIRTSVDHGTAYDLAGSGSASARGMREALSLAVRLSKV